MSKNEKKAVGYLVYVADKASVPFTSKLFEETIPECSENPTPEQLQVMRELGFSTLAEAKHFAWHSFPMNCSTFHILFNNLKKKHN